MHLFDKEKVMLQSEATVLSAERSLEDAFLQLALRLHQPTRIPSKFSGL